MSSILITGASQGIGRAMALELAGRGHRVIGTARNPENLADLPLAERLRLDVTDQASVDAAIKAAGRIDVVVNNAGETMRAPLETVPVSEVARLFDLNALGALRVVQAALPGMRERGSGHLVFLSSIQGRMVLPIIGPYGMSKWAVEAMAEVLAIETGHFGVKVSLVQPGVVATDGGAKAKVYRTDDDPYGPLFDELPKTRGDVVTPEEVAKVVADTIEQENPPLRVPAGATATTLLAARKTAPENEVFFPYDINW
ncbi:SDR family oxidoreductase [Amycolatopsis sp. NPDC047767]|uniref:SDR family oxidoreductase n=1 Tax=Amycolatopsis sp. NPDC047767 TaxID=3156765 RepID=UPI00345437C3